MSNPRSFKGYVDVQELPAQSMITLRADLSDPTVQTALPQTTGVDMPTQGECRFAGDNALIWMSPDEVLICTCDPILAPLQKTLQNIHHQATDMSDARALFRLKGPQVREVLAKLSPVDTHPTALPVGAARRTRLGQVAGAFWLRDEETADVICFRSVADYVFALTCDAAKPGAQITKQ